MCVYCLFLFSMIKNHQSRIICQKYYNIASAHAQDRFAVAPDLVLAHVRGFNYLLIIRLKAWYTAPGLEARRLED